MSTEPRSGSEPEHPELVADRAMKAADVVYSLVGEAHEETFGAGRPDGETTAELLEAIGDLEDAAEELRRRAR